MCLRLCLVPIKYFLKNKYFSEILFSEKENFLGCLAASEFVLRKINSGV